MQGRADHRDPSGSDGAGFDPSFERLVDRAFREVLALDPVRAAWQGLEPEPTAPLREASREAIEREIDVVRSLRCDLEACDPQTLHPKQIVDRELFLGRLAVQLEQLDARPRWRTMPQAPVEEILSGITVPLLRDCAAPEIRWANLLRRLEEAPALLEGAARALEDPPSCFTETATQTTESALRALPEAIDGVCQSLGEGALARSIQVALDRTLRALERYAEFLRGDLMPRSHGDFRLGGAALERVLHLEYRLPFSLDELVQLGERIYHETLRSIRAQAGAIRPGENWTRLLLELKDEHPAAEELVPAYKSAMDAAREFLRTRDLVPLPPEDELRVAATPAYARVLIPHALYIACGRFGAGGRGLFLVTPPDPASKASRQRDVLRWHSRHAIPTRAARESYPGRHLLTSLLPCCERRLRLLHPSPLFTEGWALYAEGIMTEAGFCADDRIRLLQLRERLLCACRILTDVALHTGQLSTNEAVAFLIRKAKLERMNAVAEVRRCCEHPALPLSCLVGMLLFRDLRDDWQNGPGRGAPLRDFHEAVLAHGALPFDLLRRELGLPPSREGRELLRGLAPPPRGTSPLRPR